MVEQWYYQDVQYVVVRKSRFIKNQEAKGLLRNLGVRIPLRKAPILGDILFEMKLCWAQLRLVHKSEWNS